ncbi:diguanylate cyclase domain-containing protein [Nostoc sp. DSM 114159]|jgi:diguanylate cyclase (GGDEF)-like protein/PAS domain S-box-containing protein
MITLSGYEGLIQIHDGDNSQVYRARRVKDGQSVILKILKADYPTSEQLRRYRQEYHLAYQLNLPQVIKAYALDKWQKTLVIIFEDFGGNALRQWLQQYPQGLSIDLFLLVALKIANALGQLHSQAVIHKDINPANIVLNPKTMAIKLIDLGISTQLSRENPSLQTPSALEGTLPYISPEQTGRMNRVLDYRTDFYSLGVTYYELLTGRLPFISNDPMELVHFHIAKMPPALGNREEIPQVLSDIAIKLMAKNAEDRYQSAWGLKADLEECAVQWEKTGTIAVFPLARNDICDRFQIPQKLYGREREMAALMAAFERIAKAKSEPESRDSVAELILVTGYSGIGKSALVRSLYKPITARRGYFISGKFDQFERNIPYFAVVDAFAGLVKQLLGEPDAILQQWRERLLDALGSNGQVVIDVIPDAELIIGPQPPPPELGASEAQNRFNLVFQRFIQACCSQEHPLVLFLDDMQWADLATLNLLEKLLGNSQIKYLLPIVAYRDREVSVGHPLNLAIAQLQRQEVNLEQITLAPLPLEQIEQLIAETLQQDTEMVGGLAQLAIRKTEGNPFFTSEFLKTLYSENLLTFNHNLKQWQWDLRQIEAMRFTDNVVELMVGQLQKLPPSVQDVLSTAAYLGAEFDLQTLSLVKNRTVEVVFADLKTAMERGFVVARSPLDENLLIQDYQFGHDRIQQAAYSLIPDDKQAATHLEIGQLLLQNLSETEQAENLFEIVRHLNQGRALITQLDEREALAQLNLNAGKKAKHATAYAAALVYLETGIELLTDNCWQNQYELILDLYTTAAEAAYLNPDLALMESFVEAVLSQAKTVLDKVKVYEVKIQAYTAQSKFSEAINIALEVLNSLGVNLPRQPSKFDVVWELLRTKLMIGHRPIASLVDLPTMTAPYPQAAMRILSRIASATYISAPLLMRLILLRQINLSIQWGNISESAAAYGLYGLFLSGTGDIKTSSQFGQLALNLVSQLNAREIKAKTECSVFSSTKHWIEPVREMLTPLREAYAVGLETGDLEFAAYLLGLSCHYALLSGCELAKLELDMATCTSAIQQTGQDRTAALNSMFHQAVLNLLDGAGSFSCLLIGKAFDEQDTIPALQSRKDSNLLFQLYFNKILLCVLFGEMEQAVVNAEVAEQYLDGVPGLIVVPHFYFYNSLALLATTDISPSQRKPHLQKVLRSQKKMKKWAKYGPMNHLHKYWLVEAERCRVQGRNTQAVDYYDRAIAKAKENQYIHEEALANELAAKFYLRLGKETIAHAYMVEAHYGYQRWGAIAKVKQLKTLYPQWFQSVQKTGFSQFLTCCSTFNLDSIASSSAAFDLSTVMKSSQAIASEIVLDNLLQTLMKILLENAGAQTGCLLLPTSTPSGELGNLAIAIYSNADTTTLAPADPIPPILPVSILHYVARTGESVVLDDAAQAGNFVHDPYIQFVKPLSILCYPLLNQGQLVGMVYLENQATTGTFTSDRIEFLQLLSGQAAIAITNAQLYAQVRDSEQQLKQFLEAVPVGIGVLDAKGYSYYVNQRAKELVGKEIAPEVTAEEIAQVYQVYVAGTKELYPTEQLPIIKALKGEISSVDNVEIHHGDRTIPLEIWGTPIYNETQQVQFAIVAFQDITERKRAEQILADYARELQREVSQRTAELAQMNVQLQQEIQERELAQHNLQLVNQELERLATTDGLTQVANRWYFNQHLHQEWQRLKREQQPLSLVLFDVDYFKHYNDYYGHQAGDACLVQIAQAAKQIVNRAADLVARYGGEEFVVILPNTDKLGAIAIAERIQRAIRALAIPHERSQVSAIVSVSLGISSLVPTPERLPDTLITFADRALYAAKQQGRDRYVVSP